jgi:hypothetical protein
MCVVVRQQKHNFYLEYCKELDFMQSQAKEILAVSLRKTGERQKYCRKILQQYVLKKSLRLTALSCFCPANDDDNADDDERARRVGVGVHALPPPPSRD